MQNIIAFQIKLCYLKNPLSQPMTQTMLYKLLLIPGAILLNLSLLYTIVQFAPAEGEGTLSFPSSLDDIRRLSAILNTYNSHHPLYVLLLFSSAYLFKQTFAGDLLILIGPYLSLLCSDWSTLSLLCSDWSVHLNADF